MWADHGSFGVLCNTREMTQEPQVQLSVVPACLLYEKHFAWARV